ncbi:6-hydroxymethylpterin diphosphokinase MptE-like protein [Desulfohalobium retbaense]|uniref:Motility associated factor glycosyltransferase family protein n=1 Tax=Desulfohalobium retbaense (strain ATCC 49708 / DSM 5692 / JCM 16813 / HR100) TaxID=485915 RepID=C8WZ07_DESRD|nr:6-hydroxymethylpterin diphosphokinase MptE-like protein [Desulfohalobium retbaense]ACV67923.1 protein of unknown function DUF115 [Desulfohalobium retbaense DSM 5692]
MIDVKQNVFFNARYKRNISVLKTKFFDLYSKILNCDSDKLSIYSSNNYVQVFKKNKLIFEGSIEKKLSNLFQDNLKLTALKPAQQSLKGEFLKRNPLFAKYYNQLHCLADEYANTENVFQVAKKDIGLIYVYGVIGGQQIIDLLENFNIRHLVFIERSIDIIEASLYFIDWVGVLDLIEQKNTHLNVVIDNDTQRLFRETLDTALKSNPVFIYSSMHLFQYKCNDFESCYNKLSLESGKLFEMRVVDTELRICKNTAFNMSKPRQVLQKRYFCKKSTKDSSIFAAAIVGSGPSLDESIKYLKDHKNNFTIFSCGSSLLSLYENNVLPDYHVDIERQHNIQPYINYIDKEYLNNVHVLYPIYFKERYEYADLFKSKTYFHVQNNYDLFFANVAEGDLLLSGGLTVTSYALELALQATFNVVYLFGCDLGYFNTQNHHAKGHVHYKYTYKYDAINMQVVPGNFKNHVCSDGVLYHEIETYETILKNYNKSCVLNTSNGAKVCNTFPIPSKYIYTNYYIKNNLYSIKRTNEINDQVFFDLCYLYYALIKDFKSMLFQKIYSFSTFIDLYMDLHSYLQNNLQDNSPALFNIINYTLLQYMHIVFSNAYSIVDEDLTIEFVEKANRILYDFLCDLEPELAELAEAVNEAR